MKAVIDVIPLKRVYVSKIFAVSAGALSWFSPAREMSNDFS